MPTRTRRSLSRPLPPLPAGLPVLLLLLTLGCGGDGASEDTAGDLAGSGEEVAEADGGEARPSSITDTLMLEGMPEPIALRLFRPPRGFPLPFTAYVPEDMAHEASTGDDESGSSVRFMAEFGGTMNPLAFIHLFVHPDHTDPQEALAVVRAYQAGTGVPVSMGLEPLPEPEAARRMPWADHAYAFRYQAGGEWFLGSIGLGSRGGRMFHLVTHYPAEYGDGFGPRADLVLDTWRWADGSPLRSGPEPSDVTIPSARPDSLGDPGPTTTSPR